MGISRYESSEIPIKNTPRLPRILTVLPETWDCFGTALSKIHVTIIKDVWIIIFGSEYVFYRIWL